MENLRQFVQFYFAQKERFLKKPFTIIETPESLTLKTANGVVPLVISPTLTECVDGYMFCFNVLENVDFIEKNWEQLHKLAHCTIIFVDLNSGRQWSLHPKTHHAVTEGKNLRRGLCALHYGN